MKLKTINLSRVFDTAICDKIFYCSIPSDSGLCHGRSPCLSVAFMQLSCLHPRRVEFPKALSK